MTENYISRPVTWTAQSGTVTAQSEKRGRVLLTVKLAAGREVKVALDSVEFGDVERFAPPPTGPMFTAADRDYYGDQARMFARHPGWK